jgi:hypothetical protein
MKQGFEIEALVADLKPVKPLLLSTGIATMIAVVALLAIAVVASIGVRADLVAFTPDPMFILRAGLLLLLGGGCGWAVLNMASPAIGKQGQSWKMAFASAALLPFAALLSTVSDGAEVATANVRFGLECMGYSALGALLTAIPMVLWLRRGAPTSLDRAGWLTGIAAGGFGAFAYGLHCPFNDVVYIGLYYSLAVGICAIAGRLMVPSLIRW